MEDAIETKSARLNLTACHAHAHQFCPGTIGRHDLRPNGTVSTKNLIERIGYPTDTMLDFKAFQYLKILGNKFRICVKGADKLFHETANEVHPIQPLTDNVRVR